MIKKLNMTKAYKKRTNTVGPTDYKISAFGLALDSERIQPSNLFYNQLFTNTTHF